MTQYDEKWRLKTLARLSAERSYLLRQLWGLDEETLSTMPVTGNWTAKDILAHLAYWDAFNSDRISKVMAGKLSEIQVIGDEAEVTAHNEQRQTQFKEMPLETAVAMLFKERRGFYALLETISDADLHRRRRLTTGQSTQMRTWMRRRWLHDAAHAQDLAAWRQQLPEAVRQKRLGPKYILRALLLSARKEFLLTADMISEAERTTLPVCGVWTLKDLLGHLTDWAKVGVDGLQQLAEGQAPEFDYTIALNFDEFNNANAAVRKDQSWDEIWTDFKETHHQLLHLLDTMPEAQLTREFTAPWQRPINGYLWTTIWFGHDQEHAHDIRHALKVSGWPKRLLG